MDDFSIVEKLKDKTNISYEEAKEALEKSNWDILDAMVFLEEKKKIEAPSVSVYFTNNSNISEEKNHDDEKIEESNIKRRSNGIFEFICDVIDKCNNTFLVIKKREKLILKLPMTAIILLMLFSFGTLVILYIVALFFEIDFSIASKDVKTDKVNNVFNEISKYAKEIKNLLKKGKKND
ncbi:DUF4342 domain-containing protein [Clostridium bornimense]|nr:DUF4342 domain-containing protein [Clostridium bornimense]